MSYLVDLQALPYRAGQQPMSNLATTQFCQFSSNFNTTGYVVSLTCEGAALATSIAPSVSNQTISGFSINLSAGVAGGIVMSYSAWLNN